MIKRIRQYLCKHNYDCIGKHKYNKINLWKCRKCGIYYIQHWGLDIGYDTRTPNTDGFE